VHRDLQHWLRLTRLTLVALTAGPFEGVHGCSLLAGIPSVHLCSCLGAGGGRGTSAGVAAEEAEHVIYHLVPADDWHATSLTSPYLPRDFENDGFIHCTRGLTLLLQVANTFYRDVPGEFLLLVLDERRISADVKYERGFPHIYGPLNRNAILAVYPMVRRDDGCFELPPGVEEFTRR